MLQNTGERFLPWNERVQDTYEHLHRYALAAEMATDKKVLDLASGEGYGSALLANKAAHVTGVEIDPASVHHASSRYPLTNLEFKVGSITQVPISGSGLFDVITCFEALEHITDQDDLFKEAKRLLAPGGIFLVSTPNKFAYTDQTNTRNPYHVKELYIDEFKELIARHFAYATFLGQRVLNASHVWSLDAHEAAVPKDFYIERAKEDFVFSDESKRVPLYVVAIVSDSPVTAARVPSRLVDLGDERYVEQVRKLYETDQARESLQVELTRLQIEHLALEQKRLGLENDFFITQKNLTVSQEQNQTLTEQNKVYRSALHRVYSSSSYKIYKVLRRIKRLLIGG
jgi:2-polyprenyl-3-methyl-5-hydroxy-6-metoxy-1,4-benzoquinol methylase